MTAEWEYFDPEDIVDKTDDELLEMSATIWEAKASVARSPDGDVDGIPVGITTCPLCVRHYSARDTGTTSCATCPVYLRTRFSGCLRTPYQEFLREKRAYLWSVSTENNDGEPPEKDDVARREKVALAAEAEVKFLRSLRTRTQSPDAEAEGQETET